MPVLTFTRKDLDDFEEESSSKRSRPTPTRDFRHVPIHMARTVDHFPCVDGDSHMSAAKIAGNGVEHEQPLKSRNTELGRLHERVCE